MRVAVEFCLYRAYYVNFDSQAHVERDVFKDDIPFIYKNDFNSHAHVERDSYTVMECPEFEISTHTLTWSVTS